MCVCENRAHYKIVLLNDMSANFENCVCLFLILLLFIKKILEPEIFTYLENVLHINIYIYGIIETKAFI